MGIRRSRANNSYCFAFNYLDSKSSIELHDYNVHAGTRSIPYSCMARRFPCSLHSETRRVVLLPVQSISQGLSGTYVLVRAAVMFDYLVAA